MRWRLSHSRRSIRKEKPSRNLVLIIVDYFHSTGRLKPLQGDSFVVAFGTLGGKYTYEDGFKSCGIKRKQTSYYDAGYKLRGSAYIMTYACKYLFWFM